MSDLVEIIQENVEQNDRNKINSIVAILVAFTATFMALCNVKEGNIIKAMSQVQVHSNDVWA